MKQLHEYSITELKAIAYDQLTFIERANMILKKVNEELTRRSLAEQQTEEKRDEQQVHNPE